MSFKKQKEASSQRSDFRIILIFSLFHKSRLVLLGFGSSVKSYNGTPLLKELLRLLIIYVINFKYPRTLLSLDLSPRLRKSHEQVKMYIISYATYCFSKVNQQQLNQQFYICILLDTHRCEFTYQYKHTHTHTHPYVYLSLLFPSLYASLFLECIIEISNYSIDHGGFFFL